MGSIVCKKPESYGLWWTRGLSDNKIDKFEPNLKNTAGYWLIDSKELRITDVWVGRHHFDVNHCFVLLRSDPMAFFGVYEKSDYSSEEVGCWRGHYVKREDYDDGYAIINGKSTRIKGSSVRFRYFAPHYMFLSTAFNPIKAITRYENREARIDEIVKTIEKHDAVPLSLLEGLFDLPKHDISLKYQ